MSSTIKQAVKETSGEDVVDGLYLLNQPAMTKAMNSIPGMGETSVSHQHQKGEGKVVTINTEFFTAVLAGLEGDVEPISEYLIQSMGEVQAQTKQSTVTKDFGTVIGLISLMPILDVPVTTFQYVFSSQKNKSWFVSLDCGNSAQHYLYDYKYTVVNYNDAATRELLK